MTHNSSDSPLGDSPLGKSSSYRSHYDATLLFPIARQASRLPLGIADATLPFRGVDVWTGYELSWLNGSGLPQVAIAEFIIPCDSPNIIESKSFKLYLNSFNQSAFESWDAVRERLYGDLSQAAGSDVQVRLNPVGDPQVSSWRGDFGVAGESMVCLDRQQIMIDCYHPEPGFLVVGDGRVTESLYSDLLKTNCPVTGQPDWASIWIRYTGAPIDRAGLLRYVVSFREHQDFHEHCVERIFCDLQQRCQPESLTVYARYTRRGGLDINPFRTSDADTQVPAVRLWRQ